MIKNLFYITILITLIAIKPEKFETFSRVSVFNYSLIYFLLVTYHIILSRAQDNNWMRFDVFFIIGFTIVHFQIPFLASIGIEPTRGFHIWINKDVVNYATWMSALSINIWLLGYSIIKKRHIQGSRFLLPNSRKLIIDLLTSLSLIGLIYSAGTVLLRGVYDLDSWGALGTYMLLLAKTFLILRIVYFFSGIPSNSSYLKILRYVRSNKLFSLNLSIFLILFLLSGDRGEILSLLLVIATSYSIFIKKIALRQIVIYIISGTIIFTIIGLGRVGSLESLDGRNMIQRGLDNLENTNRRDNFTDELASSVRIQYRALDTFPEKQDYLGGKTHLSTLVGVVPFASSFTIKLLDLDPAYYSSASYFTYLGQGKYASYGEGTEILGDLYINYGLYSTLFVMFIFGMYSKKCYISSNKNIIYALLYCTLVMVALGISRGSLLSLYKTSFYVVLLHILFSSKLKKQPV